MKWINITCDHTKHIIPAQQWLFKKYCPMFDVTYLDLGKKPIERWTSNVLEGLNDIDDEFIILGLDDYLPIDYFDVDYFMKIVSLMIFEDLQRYELGWGASYKDWMRLYFKSIHTRQILIPFLLYGKDTPYTVSCQFSIWRLKDLKELLSNNPNWTPWQFEVNGHLDRVACSKRPVFRWIEESAISGRRPGKINLMGLSMEDRAELEAAGLIDGSKVIYGWKGNSTFNLADAGEKYRDRYEK